MSERVVTVVPEAGLHARPAAKFVETANEYDECEITIGAVENGEQVDARSMLAVTSLGVESGDDVRILAEGEGSDDALDALAAILSTPEEGDGE